MFVRLMSVPIFRSSQRTTHQTHFCNPCFAILLMRESSLYLKSPKKMTAFRSASARRSPPSIKLPAVASITSFVHRQLAWRTTQGRRFSSLFSSVPIYTYTDFRIRCCFFFVNLLRDLEGKPVSSSLVLLRFICY